MSATIQSEAIVTGSRTEAQRDADRIRLLREALDDLARQGILELTPDQRARFDQWAATRLAELAAQYDVDTSASQKRVSWGLRIVSTLGGIAICAAPCGRKRRNALG